MMPNFVIPTLQGSLLCEDVRQEMHGHQTLVGVLSAIPAVALPIGILKLCLWTRWCNGLGKFQQLSRIIGPDEKRVIAQSAVSFELKEIEAHATNVHLFAGLQFHEFGVHHVEIILNETMVTRFPIAVVKVG